MAASSPIIPVMAFVDWNSRLRAVDNADSMPPAQHAQAALHRLGRDVSKLLVSYEAHNRFRLALRLYCGWCKGFNRSDYFRAVSSLADVFDIDRLFPSSRVNVSSDLEFGDRLIDALPQRVNEGLGIHLPNTLREQRRGQLQEKMVDTALACDLLSWVRGNPTGWALVISNDDDMVPPVFTAEAWLDQSSGKVLLLRDFKRPGDKFLRLEGLGA